MASRDNDTEDARFFLQHPDRNAHIREPGHVVHVDQQRAAHYLPECQSEFRSLGPHDKTRRRIILWRVPPDNPYYDPKKPAILKIPVLTFADEEIADRDDILLPILHQIMKDARGN